MTTPSKPRLWQETGHASHQDLINEVRRRVGTLQDHLEQMQLHERRFVEDTANRLDTYGDTTQISGKQLFWLRDLDEKYC